MGVIVKHLTLLSLLTTLALLLAGCGKTDVIRGFGSDDDGATDTDADSDTDSDTNTDAEEINGDFLKAVFTVSSDDVFAVGSHGKIIHFDGASWTWMESPVEELLSGVWGSSHDNVFAVGDGGTIIRFDGESWYQDESPEIATFHDVWGVDADDVFVVGAGTTIIRFDGELWESMETGPGPPTVLRSVWGSSSSDVYAVGMPTEDGVVLHYDGATWSYLYDVPPHPEWTDDPLYLGQNAVWGTSASDVFVAGTNDTANTLEDCVGASIAHFNGSEWDEVFEHTCLWASFISLWGSSPDDVYAVNYYAELFHFDGTNWSEQAQVDTALHVRVIDIHGSSATDVFAVGGYYYMADFYWEPEVWRFDGAEWSPVFGPGE